MKPLQEIKFFNIQGKWQDAQGCILADFLASYDMVIDDRCQFARLYDYERMILIYYRASAGNVKITIWRIHKQ